MLMADVLAIALSVIGFLLSLLGLWLLCRALWPRRVESAAARCRSNAIACFITGLLVTLVTVVVAVGLATRFGAPGQIMAFIVAFLYMIYAGIGMAGLATHVGRRLMSPVDAARPWRATVRGGITLELAYLFPLLGWFGLLPISFILGSGAVTLSFFRRGSDSGDAMTSTKEIPGSDDLRAQLPVLETASAEALP